jgi:hypothetical protein
MRARLTVRNHRGRDVPATLWLALAGGGAASAIVVGLTYHVPAGGWIATAGAGLVTGAGLLDDLATGGPRGLRGHLRALVDGHVSTGIVKLFTIAAVAVVVAASADPTRSGGVRAAGAVLIAAATNLWNGLDVRPGRALKFGYLALPALLTCAWPAVPFAPGVALASVLVLPWDAGERAMLGDAGANLLGVTVGIAMFDALPDDQVVVAAAIGVALNVLAETVTLSRTIDALPPLRWYDRLGRTP